MLARLAVLITLVILGNLSVNAQRRLAQPRPLKIENPEERQALQTKACALRANRPTRENEQEAAQAIGDAERAN